MIDFHSHILPNIDDGSKSVEETFNLIKEAENVGFDTIVSTSHYIEDYYTTVNEERKIWLDALSSKFDEQNINMKLCLGSEIYITENIIKLLRNNEAATVNGSRYVLFELPMNIKPMYLNDIVFELLQYSYIPVLAHPERYSFVQKNPEEIYDLIQNGVLMQSNFGSFIGEYGEKAESTVKKLLRCNMIHFLGSDAHRQETIYPKIPDALVEMQTIVDEEKIEELTEINPRLVLNNEKIEITEPDHIKLSLKDKIFMRLEKNE